MDLFEVALETHDSNGLVSVVSRGIFTTSQVINFFDQTGAYDLKTKLPQMSVFDFDKQNQLEIKRRKMGDIMCIYRIE